MNNKGEVAARHQPGHSHDGGAHGLPAAGPGSDKRFLLGALALIVAYMAAEVVVGLLAGSLVLLSDAAHMLTDAAAIVLALVAMRLAARPPAGGYTFGLRRAEILSAQANGLTLLALTVYFVYEGIHRLLDPPEVAGLPVLVTGLVGIVVILAATYLMSRANRTSLNVEGAFQHVLNDLYGMLATSAAGLVVLLTGFVRADAIAALVIAGLMAKAGTNLVRESGRVFLEAAPAGLDPGEIGREVARRDHVVEVHDLHVWQITSGFPALSAHVLVEPGRDCHAVRRDVEELLGQRYGVSHTTLQVDHAPERTLRVASGPSEAGRGEECAGDSHTA